MKENKAGEGLQRTVRERWSEGMRDRTKIEQKKGERIDTAKTSETKRNRMELTWGERTHMLS